METSIERKMNFSDLYGYFCGMMPIENMDTKYAQMMGGIPDLGSVKGDIQLVNQNKISGRVD